MYSKEDKIKRYNELNAEKLIKEAAAQKQKKKALAYLVTEGQSLKEVAPELHEAGKKESQRDNTLELLMKEKAQNELAKLEQSLNQPLPKSASAAHIVDSKSGPISDTDDASPTGACSVAPAALPTGWQIVVDKKTGKNYYWNKSTNVTTWTRPVGSVAAPLPERVAVWKEVVHPATQQVYFVHTKTGEKKWTKPDDIYEDSSTERTGTANASVGVGVGAEKRSSSLGANTESTPVTSSIATCPRSDGGSNADCDRPNVKRARGVNGNFDANSDPLNFR